jgi:hypothetical protein
MSSGESHKVPAGAFPRRSERVLWREVDGDAVLFREDDGRAFALNETAARVWKLCDGTLSVRQLAARLGDTYGKGCAPEAVAGLIEKLCRDGCLEVDGGPGQGIAPEADDSPSQEAWREPMAWREPIVEEIVFAACDCSTGPRGTLKIALCTDTNPKKVQS